MNDAPMAAETPVKLKLTELAKPADATPVSALAPEAPAIPPEKPPTLEDARGALQEIALGPDKEKMNAMLTQGAQLLLDAGDPKVAIAAVARSAAATPLGTELRRDVLTMIGEMKDDTFSALQEEIAALNLPKTDPARSEFAKFLEQYSSKNPDKAVSPAFIEAIRTKKQEAGALMTQVLQTDTGLAASLWAEMKGDGTGSPPNVATPDGLLAAAGLEGTPENAAKVAKLYEPKGPHPVAQLWEELKSDVPSMLITGGMIFMLISQLITPEGGGGGH